jgi:hypothetical protein
MYVVRVYFIVRVEDSRLRMWFLEKWKAARYCRGRKSKVGQEFIETGDKPVRACVACLA